MPLFIICSVFAFRAARNFHIYFLEKDILNLQLNVKEKIKFLKILQDFSLYVYLQQ